MQAQYTNKFLFLDIDGVLRTQRSIDASNQTPEQVDIECIAELNRILEETTAEIVVSSTWRLFGEAKICKYLRQWGVRTRILSVTPALRDVSRGREIEVWFQDRGMDFSKQVFVILDDDADMDYLKPYLVQTTFQLGLTKELADEAIRRLIG